MRIHVVAEGKFARVTDAMDRVDYALSPHGESILLSACGDLFRVSKASQGEDLTNTSEADEDHPSCSPSGRYIAYETDSHWKSTTRGPIDLAANYARPSRDVEVLYRPLMVAL